MSISRPLPLIVCALALAASAPANGATILTLGVHSTAPYDNLGLTNPAGTSTTVRAGSGGTISNDVENTLSATFAYNPLTPTSVNPALGFNDNRSFHANEPSSGVVDLAYDITPHFAFPNTVVAVDVWGRNANQNRDDDFTISLLGAGSPFGSNVLGSVSSLAIPGGTGVTPFLRTTFIVPTGSIVSGILITANDSDGAGNNNFTLQEIRAAVIVPEPARAVLLSLGAFSLLLRRRRD